jgi:DNA mismatch repair protein MutS2
MAQSGLHIPAHSGSEISLFNSIYADIGDEQSIEQSLSTFSGHITNIIHILEKADRRSLVILDELGAGTDPQEGAALARAILSNLLEKGITTLVTTHHPELKAFAHATPGVVTASVEFALDTLRPTYHLTIGLPGRSNALSIAQRLGMPDQIIELAKADLNPTDLRADDLLDDIHSQRERTRQARSAAEKARSEAEKSRDELSRRLEKIEDERRSVLEKAHLEADAQIQELQEEVRQTRRMLAHARQPLEVLQSVEEKVADLEETVEKPIERQGIDLEEKSVSRALRLGDKVHLRTLNTPGVITSLGEEEAEVQVGMLRIRARFADLERPGQVSAPEQKPQKTSGKKHASSARPEPPRMEIDLRGQRADDAEDALANYLDAAFLAGMPFVRIIHGKGTGKLRLAVREMLAHHPHVKSFESGGDKEGGEGVTVAKLHT